MVNNKEIKYSGYTAVPSGYECADGELSAALNLINENGAIHPVLPPHVIGQLPEGFSLLTVHKLSSGITIFVAVYDKSIWSATYSDSADIHDIASWNRISSPIVVDNGSITKISVIGNTLVVVSKSHPIHYFLYRDGSYIDLGEKPPFVSMEFALSLSGTIGPAVSDYKVKLPVRFSSPHSPIRPDNPEEQQKTKELQLEFDNILYAYLNSHVADKVTSVGLFHMPFFVRYAYRLYDGSHAWLSAPVLLLPTTIAPPILVSGFDSRHTDIYQTVTLSGIKVKTFSLVKRIVEGDINRLDKWKDIITHIDVYVSQPAYTYLFDPDDNIYTTPGEESSMSNVAGHCRMGRLSILYEEALDYAQTASSYQGYYPDNNHDENQTSGNRGHRNPSTPTGDGGTRYFDGHYILGYGADSYRPSDADYRATDKFIDLKSDIDNNPWIIAPPYNPNFAKNIKDTCSGNFYLFSEIPISDIAISDKVSSLVPYSKSLSNLVTRPTLDDEFHSHADIFAGAVYAYNSRLNIADIDIRPATPQPLRSVLPLSTPTSDYARLSYGEVYLRKNGDIIRVPTTDVSGFESYSLYCAVDSDLPESPRYIFYPDSDAFAMSLHFVNGKTINIPLTRHDFLNGAYFFGGIDVTVDFPHIEIPESPDFLPDRYSLSNSIWSSDADNPFRFTASNTAYAGSAAGNTVIHALMSAARPLSQGQFGQFPLYAFTSEGIWAIEVSNEGLLSVRQPISRDVCINHDAILQIEQSVIFPSERGIMHLVGSQVECISEIINNNFAADDSALPGLSHLNIDTAPLCIAPFLTFLKSCRLSYDYIHQRVIAFSPNYTYAYVYSLKSHFWGMSRSNFNSVVPCWPISYITLADNTLATFDTNVVNTDDSTNGILISRPLKLDAPDLLKTINTVIQRGKFQRGHVSSILYGSRDLLHWHLVWSSRDHYLRGFRGTPYKYFRIALLCNLAEDESIYGATVQFDPRHVNQPR